jgi:hypothetical protein
MNGHIRLAKTGRRKVKARRVILPWALDDYVVTCLASGHYVEPNEVFAETVRFLQEKTASLFRLTIKSRLGHGEIELRIQIKSQRSAKWHWMALAKLLGRSRRSHYRSGEFRSMT